MARITDFFQRKLDVDQPVIPSKPTRHPVVSEDEVQERQPAAKRQAYLDFGQKGLSQRTCKDCGMCYDPAFKEDMQRHRVFHQKHLKALAALTFARPESALVVEEIAGVGTLYKLIEHTKQVYRHLQLFHSFTIGGETGGRH